MSAAAAALILSLGLAFGRVIWRLASPATAVYYSITDESLTTTVSATGVVESRPHHLDPWGNPFLGSVSSASPNLFYSAGPNGIDEGGGGDDVRFQDGGGRVPEAFWSDGGRGAYHWLNPAFAFAPISVVFFVIVFLRLREANDVQGMTTRAFLLLSLLSGSTATAITPLVVQVWEEFLGGEESPLPFPSPIHVSTTLTLAGLLVLLGCYAYLYPSNALHEPLDDPPASA